MSIYLDKLRSSGLDDHDAQALRFEFLEANETKAIESHFKEKKSLKIPYFKPDGGPLSDIEGADQFYRVRYLEMNRTGFAAMTKQKNNYDQPKGAMPTAYWPLNNDWAKVVAKPLEPLIITEGELKAAKSCKEGFSTVAVGGANNWHLKGRTKELISSLKFCTWVRRPVYLCFDSDYISNKGVVLGLKRLSDTLTMHGAYVHILTLPEIYSNGDKTGLDDFLVEGGTGAVNHLRGMVERAMPYCDAAKLFEMNKRYTLITSLACVYDKVLDEKRPLDKFKSATQRTNMMRVQNLPPKLDEAGEPVFNYSYKRIVDVWLDWPIQNSVDSLVYEPGKPRDFVTCVKNTSIKKLNLWDGWGVEPKKGCVDLYLQLVDYFFKGYEESHKKWFLKWMAYPIQHPGAKLYTACVFHGNKQGTGKSLLAYTVRGVYAKNWVEITQNDVQSGWNALLMKKQFCLADEMTGSSQRKFSDLIKSMITSYSSIVNEKFIPLYTIKNCVNYIFTSNHPDSFYLEDTDRRLFIIKAPNVPFSESFFMSYNSWCFMPDEEPRKEAAQALLYYFLNEVDTTEFNPKGHAPHTDSKQEMFDLTLSDLGEFVRQARDYPDVVLEGVSRDLFSSKEMLNTYDPFGKGKVTSNGVARELTRADVPTYDRGKKVRINGTVTKYYILRNIDKWEKASLQEVVEHIRDCNAFTTETSKF